jgi:hypothetical protein
VSCNFYSSSPLGKPTNDKTYSAQAKESAEKQTRGEGSVAQELRNQMLVMNHVENELQIVVDAQPRLLMNIDSHSRESKQLSIQIKSETSYIARMQ